MKNQQIARSVHSYMTETQFNRVNRPYRKVLPTLTQRIKDLFDFQG